MSAVRPRGRMPGPAAAARRGAWALAAACALAACSGQAPAPDWQVNAHDSAQRAVQAYLLGERRVEQLEWARARAEVARTGQPAVLARVELLHCAAQVASLEPGGCPGFEALRQDAAPSEQAYADYLLGRVLPAQVALLPPAQQEPARATATTAAQAVAAIQDPLSRLVAAGVLLQTGQAGAAVVALGVDTASAQGWRRPLLAWLLVQVRQAEAAGDSAQAARLRRRVALIEQGGAVR